MCLTDLQDLLISSPTQNTVQLFAAESMLRAVNAGPLQPLRSIWDT